MPEGDSFLPRIQSVFYAVFDETIGPKIVYQVPEGLIASQTLTSNGNGSVPSSPSPESSVEPQTPTLELTARTPSGSMVSPTDSFRRGRQYPSPQKRSISSQRTLFNFSEISMYVIPPSPLCGRLVICSTKRHRVIGFPVELTGKYKRYYFRYNLCFVFERNADLSCYEPIVRKISRVFKSCEEESGFLSSAETSPQVHSVLEQLYEDLNSYSETSIPIDQFNSIELKIFPFYPNPPEVKDWMVPLALINLPKRFEENWDLTMIKVCRCIDGVNHVGRIAQLANCDIRLTRQAIAHLLYYQVIMTIDIFQYSNMYTLCKSIQWLADEQHVKDECGPYVVKPGSKTPPDWPDLLHLYSRFKIGKTVFEWMREYDVEQLGIDIRRFITFGVIKGFLRRVHRYPVLIQPEPTEDMPVVQPYADPGASTLLRKRAKSLQEPIPRFSAYTSIPSATLINQGPRTSALFSNVPSDEPTVELATVDMIAVHRARRFQAAESALNKIGNIRQSRNTQKSGETSNNTQNTRTAWIPYHHPSKDVDPPPSAGTHAGPSAHPGVVAYSYTSTNTAASVAPARVHDSPLKASAGRESRRASLISPSVPPSSPVLMPKVMVTNTPSRPRQVRSPSITYGHHEANVTPYPPQLIPFLDGDHHTDEIGVRFGCGWPQLQEWLIAIGGGESPEKMGNVVVICR